ncbi:MAG: 30S ribosomal protein S2 [Candidatus Omnitrophota bacterium]|nr:MAG: 30S ribosomal protein S2 [Candidatus Omnitrophota bacterium]
MPSEIIKQLLEAGVHFGHKTARWNPKMKKYIFGQRSGIYIVDLEKTEECLNKARDFLIEATAKGQSVLFVGTKKQAQEVVQQEAKRCGMYFVTERWPGGLLTNFATIKKSIKRLKDIEKMKEDGTFEKLTKKEIALLQKELDKLNKNFSGIVQMEKLPDVLFIIDAKKETTAVNEAYKLAIPVVGLVDTNSDPTKISYLIPGNDDATKAIGLVTRLIADSVMEGRKKFLSYLSEASINLGQKEENVDLLPEEKILIEEIAELAKTDDEEEGKQKKMRLKQGLSEEKPKMRKKG